jgi:hypothetical protein
MTTLTFQTQDQEELVVDLDDDTVLPLTGALQIASPVLAEKFEDAVFVPLQVLLLDEREVEFLAAAAKTVSNSLVEDPALEQLVDL